MRKTWNHSDFCTRCPPWIFIVSSCIDREWSVILSSTSFYPTIPCFYSQLMLVKCVLMELYIFQVFMYSIMTMNWFGSRLKPILTCIFNVWKKKVFIYLSNEDKTIRFIDSCWKFIDLFIGTKSSVNEKLND